MLLSFIFLCGPRNKPIALIFCCLRATESYGELQRAIESFVEEWVKNGYKVSVLGVGPHYREEALEMALRHGTIYELNDVLTNNLHPTISGVEGKLKPLVEDAGGTYISKLKFLCPNEKCKAFTTNGDLYIYDKNHMTLKGAVELGHQLKSKSILTPN